MTDRHRARVCALLAGAAALGAGASRAEEAAEPSTQVGEVVVTGVRAQSDEKQIPASVETVDAQRVGETVNAINVEDQLKYLPGVLIRKRHIGDTQAPMSTRTSGVGSSARSVIYVDGVLISALIANNNTAGSPRWGMAPAEAIDHIEVLYGPFSAAYPGNSVGAAVEISTRMPAQFEGSAKAAVSLQHFSLYGTKDDYLAREGALTIGDRRGPFAWRFAAQTVASDSQPLSIVTALRPGAQSGAGVPVTGALESANRSGVPIAVLGAGGLERQLQDNETLKLTYDLTSRLTLAYTLGRFGNDTDAHAQSYLRDGAGAPVYAETVNFGGFAYAVPASSFANGVYAMDETHWMNSLVARFDGGPRFDTRLVLSAYDFARDEQRTPSAALPGALSGGAGSDVRLDGTGWRTADLSAHWRPTGPEGPHSLYFGLHGDRFELQSLRHALADWREGPPGALQAQSRGKTETTAAFVQDAWRLTPDLKLTLGARVEHWRAFDGLNYSVSPALNVSQPRLARTRTSPKATLEWRTGAHWRLAASYGEAYRFPTVSELYQAVTTGPTLSTPDPNLRPEHARSLELTAERGDDHSRLRISYFEEHLADALISQSAPLVAGSSTLFNFVQNIDKVRTRGIEIVAERKDVLIKGLDLSGSVTVVDPKIIEDRAFRAAEGRQLPQVPRLRATLVATWRPSKMWTATLAARYSDRVYATIDNSDLVTHTWQGFDPYFVVDARLVRKLGEHWSAALGVDNAGDQDYFLFHPFPQRSVSAELNYRF
jgi:iron complex outermembrane receptor protein